jgi:hypothetical protein
MNYSEIELPKALTDMGYTIKDLRVQVVDVNHYSVYERIWHVPTNILASHYGPFAGMVSGEPAIRYESREAFDMLSLD